MNDKLTAYRTSEMRPAFKSGLIIGENVCQCKPPNWFSRLFVTVPYRSVWRCNRCYQVWQFLEEYPITRKGLNLRWEHCDDSIWIEAGGDL